MDEPIQPPVDPFSAPPQPPTTPVLRPLGEAPVTASVPVVPSPATTADDPTQPMGFPPPNAEVWIQPDDPQRRKKGVLLGVGVAVLAVVAAVVAVLLVVRSGEDAEAYSLTAAAQNASTAEKVAFTMHMKAMGFDIDMDARVDNTAKLMAMSANMPAITDGGKIDMIMDVGNTTIYMDASSIPGAGDVAATKWISFDMSQVPGMEQDLGALTGNNPLDAAGLFEDAANVEDLGIEDLNGEQVKHFVVTVDLADLEKAQPGIFDQLGPDATDLPDTVDYDVWVTEGNQLRKLAFSLEVLGSSIDTEMVVTSIGAIDPIEVPAEDEVTDMSGLIGSDT